MFDGKEIQFPFVSVSHLMSLRWETQLNSLDGFMPFRNIMRIEVCINGNYNYCTCD